MPRPQRDYSLVVEKFAQEVGCRVCGLAVLRCDFAHVSGRAYDGRLVDPDDVVPLCGDFTGENHHRQYDAHVLDLVPFLYDREIRAAIRHLGLGPATRRLRGSRTPVELDGAVCLGGRFQLIRSGDRDRPR